jgi:hypothetical protein
MTSLRFSYSNHITENYSAYKGTLEDLKDLVSTAINYSPFVFDAGYRKEINSNLNECNILMLDFDDGVSMNYLMENFKNVTYLLATTKSHQKEKNGLVCDRFRLIFPLSECLNITIDEYKIMMNLLITRYGADKSCKDIARFYYGNPTSETFINKGKNIFDWQCVLKQALFLHKHETKEKEIQKKPMQYTGNISNNLCDTKKEWFEKYSATQQMLNYFRFNQKFSEGGRNQFLYSVARHLQEEGCNSDFIKSETLWINSQGQGISEIEIDKTIFRSLGL